MFCAISICTAASRATWAFARDSALPYSKVFSKITNNRVIQDVPVNAFILSTTVQLLLGLIYLGSSAAFNAFVGVSVMCLGTSYAMPVAISLARGRKQLAHAPFSLGRFGFVINGIAVLWIAFAIVLFSMPTAVPPTKTNMSRWIFV
jgi:amino acid transporter